MSPAVPVNGNDLTFAEWQDKARDLEVEGMTIDDLPDGAEYTAWGHDNDPLAYAREQFEEAGFDVDEWREPSHEDD